MFRASLFTSIRGSSREWAALGAPSTIDSHRESCWRESLDWGGRHPTRVEQEHARNLLGEPSEGADGRRAVKRRSCRSGHREQEGGRPKAPPVSSAGLPPPRVFTACAAKTQSDTRFVATDVPCADDDRRNTRRPKYLECGSGIPRTWNAGARTPGWCRWVDLAARGQNPSAIDERRILATCVAPPSNTAGIFSRRALSARRLARLGATPDFHHGLLELRCARLSRGCAVVGDQQVVHCEQRKLQPSGYAGLIEHMRQVTLDRLFADAQRRGDVLVRAT